MNRIIVIFTVLLGLNAMAVGGGCAAGDDTIDVKNLDEETAKSLIGTSMSTERETLETHLQAFLVMTGLSGQFDVEVSEFRSITADEAEELGKLLYQNMYAAVIHETGPTLAPLAATEDSRVERDLIVEYAPHASHFATVRWSHGSESWTTHALVLPGARVGNLWEIIEPVTSVALSLGRLKGMPGQTEASESKPMNTVVTVTVAWTINGITEEFSEDFYCDIDAVCEAGEFECNENFQNTPHLPFCIIDGEINVLQLGNSAGGTCTIDCAYAITCGSMSLAIVLDVYDSVNCGSF